MRSAMRRTLSIRPSRSIAGIAHSSPIESGRDLLERAPTKQSTFSSVDAPLGVRDQRDRQLVDARIAGERSAGELRQLAVVAARQALAHLADVLLDDVEVVEQPLAGRADVGPVVGGGGEPGVGLVQDAAGLVQPGEQAGCRARRGRGTTRCPEATALARSPRCSAPSSSPRIGPVWTSSQPSVAREKARVSRRGSLMGEINEGGGWQGA